MSKRTNQIPPALKHGIYSGMTLLPGEDSAAFEKLHKEVIAEYNPDGPSECDVVAGIAKLMWRKQNLFTYDLAERARSRISSIYSKLDRSPTIPILGMVEDTRSPDERRALRKEADERAGRELGGAQELVDIGEVATIDHLLEELALMERLDGMIERCVKRLLFIKGLKSVAASSSAARSQSTKRLT